MLRVLRRMPGYRLLIILGALALAGVAAMVTLGGGGRLDPVERWTVEEAADRAADYLARRVPAGKGVLLVPLADDADGVFTAELARRLEGRLDGEVYRPEDLGAFRSPLEKVKAFIARLLGVKDVERVDASGVSEAARALGAATVLFGRVTGRGTHGDLTRAELALRAVKAEDQSTLFARAFRAEVTRSWWGSAVYRRIWMRTRAWWARLLSWLAAAALAPLLAARWARPLLARERNSINAAVLAAYTLFDVLLAWWLIGWAGGTAAGVLLGLAGLAGASYNYLVCDRLAAAG